MTIAAFSDVFGCLFDSIILILFYNIFLKKRFDGRIATAAVAMIIFSYIWITGAAAEKFYINNFIVIAGDFLIAVLFYKGKIIHKIFCAFTLNLISIISDLMTAGILMLTGIGFEMLIVDSDYRSLAIFMAKLIMLCIVKLIARIGNKEGRYTTGAYWILLTFILLSGLTMLYCMTYFIFYQEERLESYLILFLSVYILSNAFIVMFFFEKIAHYINYKYQYIMIEKQIHIQEEYYDTIKKISHETHQLKHDMKNHILCVGQLIENGDAGEALEYINKIVRTTQKSETITQTGNIALDAILNYKYLEAQNKNIDIKVEVQMEREIEIDSIDLCIVSGNALDNAIEACTRIDDLSERKITMKIVTNKNHYSMSVKNALKIMPARGGYYYLTNKENKAEHGFGMEIMEKTANKYNGDISTEYNEREFNLKIIMNNTNLGKNVII